MYLHADEKISESYNAINLDTNEIMNNVIWMNDTKGEYAIHKRENGNICFDKNNKPIIEIKVGNVKLVKRRNKMQAGTFKFLENWKIEEVDAYTGKVISTEEICNNIVNSGLERVAKMLNNVDGTHFRALAIGTGSTGAANDDTTLETEYARETATLSYEASYKAVFSKTFTFASGTSENITEAGIFDSSTESGSTMLARTTFSAKAVTAAVSLIVTGTITISRA